MITRMVSIKRIFMVVVKYLGTKHNERRPLDDKSAAFLFKVNIIVLPISRF